MPNASHKGKSIKPNTNAEGSVDTAADLSVNPEDLVDNNAAELRVAEAPANEAATQRPNQPKT